MYTILKKLKKLKKSLLIHTFHPSILILHAESSLTDTRRLQISDSEVSL